MAYASDTAGSIDYVASGPNKKIAVDVVNRYNYLLDQRRLADILHQDLAQYIIPRKAQITYRLAPGAKQTSLLYDTTAVKANEYLASAMSGALTPNTMQWIALQMRFEDLNREQEVREWLDQCRDILLSAINQSNFKAEAHEMYLDLGCFGTGCLLMEEIPGPMLFNGFRFKAMPMGWYVIGEGPDGRVDMVGRKIEMSARAAALKFGDGDMRLGMTKLSSETAHKAEARPDDMVGILHMVMPREGANYFMHASGKERPWASVYVEVGSSASYGGDPSTASGAHLITEGGYYELPFMVPRWGKSAHEIYGRGPGHTALPDIKTLNKARELRLRAAAKWIDPPIAVIDDGVVGKVRTQPSGITTVRSKDSIFPFELGHRGNFELSLEFEKDLQSAIRAVFYSDLLQLPSKQYMTAAEIQATIDQMQRALGPTVGRLESEFLTPLINRAFGIGLRAGVIPPPPPIVMEAQKAGYITDIDVVYIGPLARAQKYSDLSTIERFFQMAAPLIQVKPTAGDVINTDDFMSYIMDAVGLPARLKHDQKVIDQMREQEAQQNAQAQQQQQQHQAIDSASKLAPLMKVAQEAGQGGQTPNQGGTPA